MLSELFVVATLVGVQKNDCNAASKGYISNEYENTRIHNTSREIEITNYYFF